jgi:hypothetical protein
MIRIVAIALTLGVIGAQGTLAQTAPGDTTSPSPASPSVAPPSVAAPPPAPATAPPRPITGPAAMAPANSGAARSTPPAVSTSNAGSQTAAAPVAGANSFTEAEARSRLEAHGYTNVSGLQKDAQSIWRGTAMKNGQSVGVALDYQGNIVTQ